MNKLAPFALILPRILKRILLPFLTIVTTLSLAQEKVTFKPAFKPDKVYRTSTTTSTEGEIDFSGNQQVIDQLKAQGTTLPLVIIGTTESITTTTTGALKADNTIPARTVYDRSTSIQNVNGKEVKRDNSLEGVIIEGYYEKGNQLVVDTIISSTLDPLIKTTILKTLELAHGQIKFPEAPLQVGDTFDQNLPLQIPLPGASPVKIVINTNYKLSEIKNGKAIFDIVQNVTLDMEIQQTNMSASGGGTGFSEFDIEKSTITRYDSDLRMKMTITLDSMLITATTNAKSKLEVTVE